MWINEYERSKVSYGIWTYEYEESNTNKIYDLKKISNSETSVIDERIMNDVIKTRCEIWWIP